MCMWPGSCCYQSWLESGSSVRVVLLPVLARGRVKPRTLIIASPGSRQGQAWGEAEGRDAAVPPGIAA